MSPMALPKFCPVKICAAALVLSRSGTHFASTSVNEVGAKPSPNPTTNLVTKKKERNSVLNGAAMVATDHNNTPMGRILRPPKNSERMPPGICMAKKPRKKAE
uniref:Uncharacterized protein n=1 Tax=Pyramimonas obovata TaxID=1411642 RepID=A0A7S0N060_9CHLO